MLGKGAPGEHVVNDITEKFLRIFSEIRELAQRQEERKVQIDLMKALLEGTTSNPIPRQSQPNIYFRKLTEADDLEAYLTTFERLVTSEMLEQQHWAFKLAPHLTGKAQQAYAALSSEEAANYTKLKEAILQYYYRELPPTVQNNF